MGGMSAAIESGLAKSMIEESAAKKQARVDSGADVVVGVNKYKLENPEEVDVLSINNESVRKQQIAKLEVRAHPAGAVQGPTLLTRQSCCRL